MTPRLKIASDILCALIANPQRYDYIAAKVASGELSQAEATNKNVHKALLIADALIAEHERTRPATVGEALADLSNKTIAGQSAQEVAERYRELEGRYSETESDIASLTDALNGALRNAGLDGEQMQAPCLREMKSLIWLLSYAAVRGQQLAAQPGTAGRESDGQCEATAEQNRCPPSTPAATPREIPESVVEACVGVYYNEIGTPLTTTDGAMRAALNEYDRQMPALRGRVLGERWQVRFADGEVSERTHWSKESADVVARASGGTVHRVALVEMGEVDDGR